MELGNAAAAALLFGQIISGKPFDHQTASIGFVTLVILYGVGLPLMKGVTKNYARDKNH